MGKTHWTESGKRKMMPLDVPLTTKQHLFVREFLVDMDKEAAYIRAGYTGDDGKGSSALLRNPKVQRAIQGFINARITRLEIDADRVLQEYAKIAFLNPRDFYDEDGNLLPIHKMPQNASAALSGIDVVSLFDENAKANVTTAKIKFIDKKGALDSLAKHLGMFVEKVEHTGKDGKPIEHVQSFGGTAEDAYRRMIDINPGPKKIGR